jgi:hypothetical protein
VAGLLLCAALALLAGRGHAGEVLEGSAHREMARRLEAAASCPAASLRLLAVAGGSTTQPALSPEALRRSTEASFTLAFVALGGARGRFADEFVVDEAGGEAAVLAALTARRPADPLDASAEASCSLLQAHTITRIELQRGRVHEREMEGVATVVVPGAYSTRIAFRARRVNDQLIVDRIGLPSGAPEVHRYGDRWFLASWRPRDEVALPGDDPGHGVLELPVVQHAGRRPPQVAGGAGTRSETVVVVRVDRAGVATLDGDPTPRGVAWIRRHLRTLLGASERGGREFILSLVLDVDRDVPWSATHALMACVAARTPRVFLGVRVAGHDEPAALAVFSPSEATLPWLQAHGAPALRRVEVLPAPPGGASSPGALDVALGPAADAPAAEAVVELGVAPWDAGVPSTGDVVAVLERIVRTPVRAVLWDCPAPGEAWETPNGFQQEVARHRARRTPVALRVDDGPVLGPGPHMHAGEEGSEGLRDGYVGSDLGLLGLRDPGALPIGPVEGPGPRHGPARPSAFLAGRLAPWPPPEDAWAVAAAAAARRGRDWLAAHQSPSGLWEAAGFDAWCQGQPVPRGRVADDHGQPIYDIGVTGLALQAFLAAGYTDRGDHPYVATVARGLRALRHAQDAEGCVGDRDVQQYVYNHAMAALALVEAHGLTGSRADQSSAQRAVDFILLCRNPASGWRYGIRPGDTDTSVTCAMVHVLGVARALRDEAIARGATAPLVVDEAAFAGAAAWLEEAGSGINVGYLSRGSGSARRQEDIDRFPASLGAGTTAMACWMRWLLGEEPLTSTSLRSGLRWIRDKPPTVDPPGAIDREYWRPGALAAWQEGGATWEAWAPALRTAVVERQRTDGDLCGQLGSWDPDGAWGAEGGRVAATASGVLCCEVMRRYPRPLAVR